MTRAIPFDILEPFLIQREAVKFRPYRDSVGVLTVGCGHTGPDVHPGVLWTQERVDEALKADLTVAAVRLQKACGGSGPLASLTDHQYAALLSFVFNVGADPSWSIWRALKEGRIVDVPKQMARFVFAGGKQLQGLVNRRAAEVALWNTPDKNHAVIA